MSGENAPHRLDPDLAASAARRRPPRPPPPVIDPRPYRWGIGLFGVALVILFSIYQLSSHGLATPGVPAGGRLHYFAAPLATSTLNGDANLAPPCRVADHDARALNVCLLAHHGPLVLAFFSTGSAACVRQVDALQSVASGFPAGRVQFAAVAVRTGHTAAAALVHSHGWSIPVAYDRDGGVGALYDVELCPLVELARRGGVVSRRLIGEHWTSAPALAAEIRTLPAR